MTSRERILTAFRCERPDHVPVSPFGLGRLDPDGPVARRLIALTDPILPVSPGADVFLGSGVSVERRVDGDSTTTVIHTPAGDLARTVRKTAQTSATVRFPFQGPDDVDRFRALPYAAPVPDLGPFQRMRERVGEEALVMVGIPNAVCLPASWYSPEGFCLAWADAPDMVRDLTALASERLLPYVDNLCRQGVDAFRIIGGEYASVQLGPRGFDALVSPFDRELVDVIHRHGAIAYYHNHGPVMGFLDRFAALGIDALDPLEAPPWGDCDLAAARARIGERVCLVGNLDDMEVLERLDPGEVKAIAEDRLGEAGPSGFVLGGTASGIYGERAAEGFIAMVDVAKAFAGMEAHA